MSNIPKAREELAALMKQLENEDLPKSYIIEKLRHAMLFMFKNEAPPESLRQPILEDHLKEITVKEVELMFDTLENMALNERDHHFVRDVHESFDEYGSVTGPQWKTLVKIHRKNEKGIGVTF